MIRAHSNSIKQELDEIGTPGYTCLTSHLWSTYDSKLICESDLSEAGYDIDRYTQMKRDEKAALRESVCAIDDAIDTAIGGRIPGWANLDAGFGSFETHALLTLLARQIMPPKTNLLCYATHCYDLLVDPVRGSVDKRVTCSDGEVVTGCKS